MAHVAVASNRLVDPLAMKPGDVVASDIAAALAKICRWGGMCNPFYSVAEHSVRVATRAAQMVDSFRTPDDVFLLRQYALLHDAAEAYLGDLRLPLKRLPEFQFYRDAEHRLLAVIHERAGLDPVVPEWVSDAIKMADAEEADQEWQSLMLERNGLALEWRQAESLYAHHLAVCFPSWARL